MIRMPLVAMLVAGLTVGATARSHAAERLPITCPMQPPERLDVDRQSLVRLGGGAVRSRLLGLVELYTIAIYVPAGQPERASLLSDTRPKILWLGVCYDDSVPAYVPHSWRRELVPPIGPLERQRLRMEFVPLRRGDIVTIAFVAGAETTRIEINRREIIANAGPALMTAFLDHWIGQAPVSQELKRALVP